MFGVSSKLNKSCRYLICLVFLLSTGSSLAASKSDLAKEKRWQEQIEPSLMVGDAVKLKAAGVDFLALYAENSTDKTIGGAIVIHGIGVHPAWPDVIEPIRINLPDYGWHTLSLQMPILRNEAEGKDYIPLMDEVPARIQAGVDYLKAKGIKNIVIIAHSLGTAMAGHYLSAKPDPSVRAYVGIGMGHFKFDKRFNNVIHLSSIKLPVLDIYGSQDLDTITSSASLREQAARKAKNKTYRQIKIEGANHFFSNMDDVLVKRIRGWLMKNAK